MSATRGAAIVGQVLSFARGFEGSRIEVQPADLVKDIRHIVRDTFPKNIRLETSVPQDAWWLLGDPHPALPDPLDLLRERAGCHAAGRPHQHIAVANRNVRRAHRRDASEINAGPYVAISVTDTGVGIPAENLDKIFEPFITTKEIGSGSGLGLSTLLAVVRSHGGFVNVESERGKGTTFSLYFPAKTTPAPSGTHPAEASHPRGNGEMILLVDDEDSILRVGRQTLKAFGYHVMTAPDGVEALAIYEKHKDEIAVVLTDMMMPIMDGPATIRAMRNLNPAVKIIAASGLNSTAKGARPGDIGIKHFLMKPYTAQTLLETLRKVLSEN